MKIEQITMNSFRIANKLFTRLNQLARVCNACPLPDFNLCPQAGRPRCHNAAATSTIPLRGISGYAGTVDVEGCLCGDWYCFGIKGFIFFQNQRVLLPNSGFPI